MPRVRKAVTLSPAIKEKLKNYGYTYTDMSLKKYLGEVKIGIGDKIWMNNKTSFSKLRNQMVEVVAVHISNSSLLVALPKRLNFSCVHWGENLYCGDKEYFCVRSNHAKGKER